MKKITFILFLQFGIVSFLPIFAQTPGDTKTFKDGRDQQIYKAVFMPDGKWWMAENLRYRNGLDNPIFANNTTANTFAALKNIYYCPGPGPLNLSVEQADPLSCEYWGVLYPWWAIYKKQDNSDVYSTVGEQGLCPEGWHLPSNLEWETLITACGTSTNAGRLLKDTIRGNFDDDQAFQRFWTDSAIENRDSFRFKILASGMRTASGAYQNNGTQALFWTSTANSNGNQSYAYIFNHDSKASSISTTQNRADALNARCLEGDYMHIPIISMCGRNIIINNYSNYSSFIFNIDGVDQASTSIYSRLFTTADDDKIVKVKGYTTEGWSAYSRPIRINNVIIGSIPSIPLLSTNTSAGAVDGAIITTSALCETGYTVAWFTTETQGTVPSAISLSYSGSNYTLYAAAMDTSTGCMSIDKAIVSIIPYSGTFVQRDLIPGTYQMECWGARGGAGLYNGKLSGVGGGGGYTKGTLLNVGPTSYFIYVGGAGGNASGQYGGGGGYNGGGSGGSDYGESASQGEAAGGGGGASDIRIDNSIAGRIMVAGGGSGTAISSFLYAGGNWSSGGHLGYGAAGGSCSANPCVAGSGGGGGYYGGTGGVVSTVIGGSWSCAGSGGSSFISGYSGPAINNIIFSNVDAAVGARGGNGTVVIVRIGN